MDELRSQVSKARRRLIFAAAVNTLSRTLFVALLLAVLGLAIPKYWPISVPEDTWVRSWLFGCLGVGLVTAIWFTWRKSASALETALEIDRRYGLKERISSTLALSPGELETEAAQALVADATHRMQRIDVREKFSFRAHVWNFLPLLPAIVAFVLVAFVPNAKHVADATTASVEVKQQIERSTDALKKKLAERRKLAEAQGLTEAEQVFSELEKRANKLNDADANNRKQALAKLNDMADAVKKRRAEMGDREGLKKQLSQLKDLKPGPADQMAKAMKSGDFGKAMAAIEKLQAQLKSGELNEKQMKQMAEQMKQMADKLQQMAAAHQDAQQELKKQIEQAKQAGDLAKAGQLQNQLDKLNMNSPMMNQLNKMAQQLASASQAAKSGQPSDAASQMQSLAEALEQMQSQSDQLEMLEDALGQLASAKSALNCESCGGTGCQMCQGNMDSFGMGSSTGQRPGMGMGQGQGVGDRPEAETGSQFYNSRVNAEIRRGKAVITGFAGGPNRAGESIEEVKAAIESGEADDDDPLTGARVPRAHRDHAQQYFDSLRDG